jgi:hypothetical protein
MHLLDTRRLAPSLPACILFGISLGRTAISSLSLSTCLFLFAFVALLYHLRFSLRDLTIHSRRFQTIQRDFMVDDIDLAQIFRPLEQLAHFIQPTFDWGYFPLSKPSQYEDTDGTRFSDKYQIVGELEWC